MKQEIIVVPKEKGIDIIPYWKRKSFWVIREVMNQMEADEHWKPGRAFDIVCGILLLVGTILLTYITSV